MGARMRPNKPAKPGRNYKNGRAAEYAARDVLEAQGWHVTRAAGSKGAADLVAVRDEDDWLSAVPAVLFVSCKRGTGRADWAQRERLARLPRSARVEIWTRVRGGFEREVIR